MNDIQQKVPTSVNVIHTDWHFLLVRQLSMSDYTLFQVLFGHIPHYVSLSMQL